MKIAKALFALSVISFAGCAWPPVLLPESKEISRHGIELHGEFTESRRERLDKILDALPKNMIKAVNSISINDDSSHYDNYDSPCSSIAGHCHHSRDICIKSIFINTDLVVWHEVGHAYSFKLYYSGSDFETQWEHIAGDVYTGKDGRGRYPRDGVLSAYGARNIDEDIAVWTEFIYTEVADGGFKFWHRVKWNQARGVPDRRYRLKLDLLYQYGFITEENYYKFLSTGLIN